MDLRKLLRWALGRGEYAPPVSVVPRYEPPPAPKISLTAIANAKAVSSPKYPLKMPLILPNVVPKGVESGIAMDSTFGGMLGNPSGYGFSDGGFVGFPGYPHLSMLSTIAEFRAMSSALSTELTREWITINSTETANVKTKTKVTELTQALKDYGIQQVIQRAAEHDAQFGRAQILISIKGQGNKLHLPLKISPKTIAPGSFIKVSNVEPFWTTPVGYNSLDPSAKDFYKPSKWFMIGQEVHSDRLLTIVTRPVSDILKPAFNFGGMSLYQLAEPYVENWLRTRTSVSDLISNFSIINLATTMSDSLSGGDGSGLVARAQLFAALRDNRGLMLTDMTAEKLDQIAVPLSGLDKLQAQAQEHMCAVSRMPAIILTGIEPTGLNASSEGSIRSWYDWVAALQEAYWRHPIEIIFKIIQLSMYGEIDPDISFDFVPLFQLTEKELSDIRTADATAATAYINAGAIDGEEVREKLARDPQSGFQGLDLSKEIIPPDQGGEDNEGDDETDDK